MNILLINNIFSRNGKLTVGGVEYHRMAQPHKVLKRLYSDFDVMMANNFEDVSDDILNQTNLVVFSRSLGVFDKVLSISEKLNKLGIPFALDLDDYWWLPDNHIAYDHYKESKSSEATEISLRHANFVICTTSHLADKILPINPNVFVIENGIDSEDEVWQSNKTASKRIRFGFTQGDSHFEDISLIANDVARAFKDEQFYKRAQVCLTGFAANELYLNKKTIPFKYEEMLTDKLKVIRRDFPDYVYDLKLLRHTDFNEAPYKRVWYKDALEFGNVYNDIDISVVPLTVGQFNSCKSELKMLEAGFKDCAVMVSHVKPYDILATSENSFNLSKQTFFEWQKYILYNPECVKDKAAQLKEDVKKYDLKLLTEKRKQLYLNYKNK